MEKEIQEQKEAVKHGRHIGSGGNTFQKAFLEYKAIQSVPEIHSERQGWRDWVEKIKNAFVSERGMHLPKLLKDTACDNHSARFSRSVQRRILVRIHHHSAKSRTCATLRSILLLFFAIRNVDSRSQALHLARQLKQ